MTDGELAVRRRAVAVAGHAGDLAAARAGLTDPEETVRSTAVGAVDRLGELSAQDMERALADESALVRRRALSVLAKRPGDQAPSALPLLADGDPVVAETAAWVCGERSPVEAGAAAALVTIATDHVEHLAREAAVAALGAIGDPVGLPAILAALNERATIRRRAVVALAAFEGPEVDAALTRSLEDRDRQVRQTAEDLLS